MRTVTDNIYFRSGATSDDYKFSELFVDKIKTRLQRSLLDIFAKNDIKMNNPTSKWIFSTKNPLFCNEKNYIRAVSQNRTNIRYIENPSDEVKKVARWD